MAYTSIDFPTKKDLITAIKNGVEVTVFSPGPFGCPTEGTICIEGPQFPAAHKFYAQAVLKNGKVISVK